MPVHLLDQRGDLTRCNAVLVQLDDSRGKIVCILFPLREDLRHEFAEAVARNLDVDFSIVCKQKHALVKAVSAVPAAPAVRAVAFVTEIGGKLGCKQLVYSRLKLATKKFVNRLSLE